MNNWGGSGLDPAPYPEAASAFTSYNGAANYDSPVLGDHHFNFTYGDVAFFVMDTRRHRSDVDSVEPSERTMLGERQLEAFNSWLAKVMMKRKSPRLEGLVAKAFYSLLGQ